MISGYGGSEDDRGRDREIISVIGSPTGSESVTGSQSIALPPAKPRAIDWFSVGTWSGISETDGAFIRDGATEYELFRNELHTVTSHTNSTNMFFETSSEGSNREISGDA